MTKFPMTAAGYSALQDELNQRMSVTRPRLIQRMQEAIADDSNLAENSEYHAAQADKPINEARIVELERRMRAAEKNSKGKRWTLFGLMKNRRQIFTPKD